MGRSFAVIVLLKTIIQQSFQQTNDVERGGSLEGIEKHTVGSALCRCSREGIHVRSSRSNRSF
jgi:hypothetical protein